MLDDLCKNGVSRYQTMPVASHSNGADSDASLFRRFREYGDVDAFDKIFRRHRDALFAYLWTLAGNQNVAEDISQYCWLRLVENNGESGYRPQPGATLLAYLRKLGRNRYIDEYKRKHGETRTEIVDDIDARPGSLCTALDAAASMEIRLSIQAALAGLPFEQRDTIALWLQGFTINEMVRITDAPRDTVLSRKKYALKKLKAVFETAGVELHDAAF